MAPISRTTQEDDELRSSGKSGFKHHEQFANAGFPKPSSGSKDEDQQLLSYWKLFSYADRYDYLLMFVGSLSAMVSGLIFPAILVVQSHLINNFGSLQNHPHQLASKVSEDATFLVYTAMVALIASYFEVSCWMKTGERQVARIRADYLRAILRQNVGYFDSDLSTAEVVGNVSVDTLLVQEAISEKVGNFIENLSHFIGGYLVGFTQIWRLALVMLPFFPLLIIPGSLYSRALSEFAIRRQSAYSEAGIVAEQALSSIRTVYSFTAEGNTLQRYSAALQGTVKLGMKQGLAKGLAMGSSGINFALWAFMAWYGSHLVTEHHANGGQVLTTGFAVLSGGIALGNATPNLRAFAEGRVAGTRIFRMIHRVPPIDSTDVSGKTPNRVAGNLEFRDVEFAYPSRPDITVLKSFNLRAPAGKTVALVGSSGSGKSTIISLLERFYDPVSGSVTLDGVDLRDLQLTWLRKQIGLVNQEPGLFATSIRENILYGKPEATSEEIIEVCKLANAHEFIMQMPQGYDTQVGERGVQLSGGQKQRIAIARALIRNPPILLLDEATSALDSVSEQAVQQALEKARVKRTTIIVAHRLSTIQSSDMIIVLQSGRVVESGNHQTLVSTSGSLYASLLSKQQNSPPSAHTSGDLDRLPAEVLELRDSSGDADETQEQVPKRSIIASLGKKKRKQAQQDAQKNPSFARLMALNKPEWKQGLLGLWGAISFGFVHPFYAFLIGSMVSSFYSSDPNKLRIAVRIHVLAFLGLGVASFVVNLVQHWSFAALGESLTRRIRERMLESMLRFEVGWFDREENSTGALCSRLATDASSVRSLVGDRVSLLVQTASATAVSCIVGLITSWRLALVIIAIQPLIIACYCVKNICLRGFAHNTANAQKESSKIAAEAVAHHRTVAAFCAQERVLELFESKLEAPRREIMKRSQIAGLSLGFAQLILYASWGLDFWFGSVLVKNGESTFGAVLKTVFILVSTGRVLAEAGTLSPDVAKGMAAVRSVFEILDRETSVQHHQGEEEPELANVRGDLELSGVSFSYPSRPDVKVLSDLNLKVEAGQTVALVGESGSGKSSVVGLIERFYEPKSGRILIDGRDIRGFGVKWLRKQIGLVSQEPTLFAASIWENIAFGKENATDAEVVQAARAANAHNFISALPQGYKTFAGEKGVQLSGGQKQRIAIARAIIKDPRILLLDEATSALDSESEGIVQKALERMMVGRSSIVVAHRMCTIQDADKIAVVQAGRIVDEGTHQQLLHRGCSAYLSLIGFRA